MSCDDESLFTGACIRQLGFDPVKSEEDLRLSAGSSCRRLPESPLKRLLSQQNLAARPLPRLSIRTKAPAVIRRVCSEGMVLNSDYSPLMSERCSELSCSSSEPICIPPLRCVPGSPPNLEI